MISHWLNECPRVCAGSFYEKYGSNTKKEPFLHLLGPLNYANIESSQSRCDSPESGRLLPGHAEIIVETSRVSEEAEQDGDGNAIIVFEGPDSEYDFYADNVQAWFKGDRNHSLDLIVHRIEVKRTQVQRLWIGEMTSRISHQLQEIKCQKGNQRQLLVLLDDIYRQTDDQWMYRLEQRQLEAATAHPSGVRMGRRI